MLTFSKSTGSLFHLNMVLAAYGRCQGGCNHNFHKKGKPHGYRQNNDSLCLDFASHCSEFYN